MKTFSQTILLCLLSLLLVSCGGNSSSTAERSPVYAATVQAATAADYNKVVQHIYVAYFGRPADVGGLAFFSERFLAIGAPTDIVAMSQAYNTNADARALIDVFSGSQESKDLYPGDNGVFMDAVYLNLFGRAPDAAGKAWWVNQLNTGAMTRASAAVNVMAGAQSTDIDVIVKKTTIAGRFTAALDTVQRSRAYSGLAANVIVRNMLATVVLGTDLSTFQPAIDSTIATLVANLPPAAEGLYTGKLSSGTPFHMLVLEDDQYWGLYGSATSGMLRPYGFIQGQGASSNGAFSSSDMKDFGPSPAVQGSVTGTYAALTSITGKVTMPTGAVDFTTSIIGNATYNYSGAPSLSDIAGNWRLSSSKGDLYTLSVAAGGGFSGTATACSYSGSLAPRRSGKNVFDATWNFGAGVCPLSGQAAGGVAFSYLINEGATRELIVTGVNAGRTAGTSLVGWTATALGQPAAFVATDTVLGTGAVAAAGNEISVHYTGWLYNANGANFKSTKFDSSRDRGTPFNFTLGIGAVIAGWDRGVAGMKVGGKRTLIIPASLGYGGTGNASIPPNAGMVFEVELLTVIR